MTRQLLRGVVVLLVAVSAYAWGLHRAVPRTVGPTIEQVRATVQREHRRAHAAQWAMEYGIDTVLAEQIVYWADHTGISHNIAFRLVWVESRFNPQAVSHMGAIGLTQVMPQTARILDSTIVDDAMIYDVNTNLRLGFTYLRDMLVQFEGDMWLALTAYNRGPTKTAELVARDYPRITGNFTGEYAYEVLSRTF